MTTDQNMEKIMKYQKLPHYKQKTTEWFNQRNNYLTASTIATAIGLTGKVAQNNLLINKASNGTITDFSGNEATFWGTKYEPVANSIYAHRNNVIIYEFGLITNDKYPCLAVSPDGITQYRMLEIKCPWSRIINGKIKTEYYHQMQNQMAVCEFDSCDFLECKFIEVNENQFWDDFYYNDPNNSNTEKGIIISYINVESQEVEYIYSPIEHSQNEDDMKQWRQQTIDKLFDDTNRIFIGESYWYLMIYSCQLVKCDPQWIIQYYPILQAFWDKILYYRQVGIDELLNKIKDEKQPHIDEDVIPITNYFSPIQENGTILDKNNTRLSFVKHSKCLL